MNTILVLISILMGSSAFGISLAEKAKWKEAKTQIDGYIENTTKECGVKIAFDFDQDSFKGWDWEKGDIASRCGDIFQSMNYLCSGSPEGKAAIAKTIKRITCFRRKDDSAELHTIKAGAVRFSVEQNNSNQNNAQWLKQAMRDGGSVNLGDAEDWRSTTETLADRMKSLNSKCQTSIELELERKSFKERFGEHPHASLCDKPIDAVQTRCEKEEWRNLAKSKVRKIHCFGSKTLENSRFVSLKGGVLKFEVGKLYPNDWNAEQSWMDAALK